VFLLVVVKTWRLGTCDPLEQVSSSISGFDNTMCQQEGNSNTIAQEMENWVHLISF